MENYFYFWGHTQKQENTIDKSCLSQWFQRDFIIDNLTYRNAEQYMMAKKALLFNDEEIFQKIMAETSPKKIKALGRKVKGFNPDVWDENAERFVYEANLAKFSQNEDLKEFLLSTKGIIVEASPYDKIWGIGLKSSDPKALSRDTWNGENKLGFVLTRVREVLS